MSVLGKLPPLEQHALQSVYEATAVQRKALNS